MYAQNPMFSGVSPGRMAEARRFAQGGQMGRAKQQFELGGGQWNPQVHQGLRQQDSIGQMIPGGGGPPMPPPGMDRWNPGGPPQFASPGFETGGPDDPAMGGSGYMTRPGMGGGMRGPQGMPPQWDAFPGGRGGWAGGGPEGMAGPIGSFPNMPPQFQGGGPAGWGGNRGGGFGPQMGGEMSGERGMPGPFGGRPEAGPPVPRRLPGRTYY